MNFVNACYYYNFKLLILLIKSFLPRILNASIAGIVGVTCVFPLDLAKTRWQNTPAVISGQPRLYNS